MSVYKCRVCHNTFFEEPLLKYRNMPRAAQFLPKAEALYNDRGIDLEVCQCSGCGLVQLSNDPVHYHKEVIRAADVSEEMKDFRRKQFGAIIQKFRLKNKKVIEIGCGRGEYLSIIQQCGAQVFGLEYSKDSVKQCSKNGLNVSKGYIESSFQKIASAPFDAFFILNFLEHMPDPNSTLRGMFNNLADGAIGLVEVPNFDMILRNNLFAEFICDHLFYFTRETLTTALRLNGFEILKCNEIWYDFIISAIVKKRKAVDISHFDENRKHLKEIIEEYISRYKDMQVAIWGAGHQALTIISLMKLAGRIKYVIDSAIFKQGKYTPVTHIPIVSPDTLISDPVDAVIIMAASYSDEVARIIHQRFDNNIQISILRNFGLEQL